MSRKLSLIPIGVIIVAGAAWASSLLFPDTVTFPRFPGGAGTLSGALSLFDPITGSARDTQKLGGTGSLGYLKGSVCPNPYEVWRGIDASGNAICGKNLPILSIGTFYEFAPGCVEVLPSGTSTWVAGNGGTTLKSGDIVRTKNLPACEDTTTVKFVADNSILRLDKNTTVELQSGELDGNTVAQAILQNGSLWGRVLTSTGVNIGGGGLIAGVRGTSIRLEYPLSASQTNAGHGVPIVPIPTGITNHEGNFYRMSVIHSTRNTDAIKIIEKNSTANGGLNQYVQRGGNITFESSRDSFTSTDIGISNAIKISNPGNTYYYSNTSSSLKIKANTLKDITYLKSLPQTPLITAELAATLPSSESDRLKLCDTNVTTTKGYWYGEGQYGCVLAYADDTTGYDLKWLSGMNPWEALAVKDLTGSTDWSSFKDGNNIGNFSEAGNPFTPTMYRFANLYEGVLGANASNINNWYNMSCAGVGNTVARAYCGNILKHYETAPRGAVTGNLYKGVWVKKKSGRDYSSGIDNWAASWGYDMIKFISGYRLIGTQRDYSINTGTLNITQAGQYLTYVGSNLEYYLTNYNPSYPISELAQLTDKTITIELGGPVGIYQLSGQTRWTIADFGTERYYLVKNGTCGTGTTGNYICKTVITGGNSSTTQYRVYNSEANISLTLSTTPTQFIIGNTPAFTPAYNQPIGTSIQKIIIHNN